MLYSVKNSRRSAIFLAVLGALVAGLCFEIYSLLISASVLVNGGQPQFVIDPFFSPRSEFWSTFYYAIPRLMFVLLFGWLIFIAYRSIGKRESFLSSLVSLGYPAPRELEQNDGSKLDNNQRQTKRHYFLVPVAVALSIVVGIIPYLHTINPEGNGIGTDYRLYHAAIEKMYNTSVQDALAFASSQDRPLTIIIFYLIALMTDSGPEVLKAAPSILATANSIAIFFLTKEITRNNKIAGIAAIIEAISIHTIVGIGAGYYANWTAFIFVNIGLAIIFRAIRARLYKLLIVGSVILSVATFAHAWTWFFIMTVFVVLLAVSAIASRIERSSLVYVKYAALVLGVNLAMDLAQYLTVTGSGTITGFDVLVHRSGVEAGLGIFAYFNIENAATLPIALSYSFLLFMGGALSSVLLLSLGFIGIGSREKFSVIAYRLLVVWIIISTLGILFSPIGPRELLFEWTQSRFIFFLPLSILAGVGLVSFHRWLENKLQVENKISVYALQLSLYGIVLVALFNIYLENIFLYVFATQALPK